MRTGEKYMKGKKMAIIGLCLFMITTSISVVIGKAEDTENGTSDSSGTTSNAGSWYPLTTIGRITYKDGNAMGTFIHFTIDENASIISNYTIKLPPNWPWPSSTQNTTIFSSITVNDFKPVCSPNTFGEFLTFQGKNALMIFYDYDIARIDYDSSDNNTKIIFEVPDGLEITAPPDNPGWMAYSAPDIEIKSNNTYTSITISNASNGDFTIHGQTIEINLNAYESLDIFSWFEWPVPSEVNDFWYNDLNITQDKTVIENAKNNGTIPAEGWYTKNELQPPTNQLSNQITQGDVTSNYYTYDDPTFNMNFNSIDGTGVEVIVDSQIPTGRIVIINVDKEVLQTTSFEKLLVSFDSVVINPTDTLETLMEKVQNKDMDPAYYALSGERLTTVFVYVPHFSTHTISIKSLTSGIAAASNVILPIILSALFICLSIGGIILQKRKQQDDF